jgi:uncharacterized protein YlxW (UPF0749 family)
MMFLSASLALLFFVQTVQSPLPQRDPLNVEDVFQQLGRCNVNLSDEQKYVQKLSQRIRELEQELAKRSK